MEKSLKQREQLEGYLRDGLLKRKFMIGLRDIIVTQSLEKGRGR